MVGAIVLNRINTLGNEILFLQRLIKLDMTAPDPMYDNHLDPDNPQHKFDPWSKPTPPVDSN
jgi:hypothetical protein